MNRVNVSLDSLDDATFRAMNDVDFPVARVLEGIEAASEAGLPGQGQRRRQARRQRRRDRRAGPPLPRVAATPCASSSSWTSARRTAGGSTTSCRRRDRRADRRRLPARAGRGRLPRRGRAALALPRRRRRGRRHLLGHAALLRRLHAVPHLRRGEALHLSLRGAWHGPPRARPLGGHRRRAHRGDRRRLVAPRRPVLGDPHGAHARAAADRDELHRWLSGAMPSPAARSRS